MKFGYLLIAATLIQGAIDPDCTKEMICTKGYTRTVRPPVAYTNNLKRKQMDALGMTEDMSQVEEDHQVPLECGGAPQDPNNLWPEPWTQAREKDKLETRLHRCICHGKITLEQCQHTFLGDWKNAIDRLKKGEECPVL